MAQTLCSRCGRCHTFTVREDSPGALVGWGNTSEIFEWGPGAVVKLLRPGIPASWAVREARSTALARDAGLPAPRVFDVIKRNGTTGIVFERVPGPSMWACMIDAPGDAAALVAVLTGLQDEVNACVAPRGIPSLRERLAGHIAAAPALAGAQAASIRAALDRLPDGSGLCHFDLHPNNVIMSPDGPVVVDWFDAATGPAMADRMRSAVLIRTDAGLRQAPGARESLVTKVYREYVRRALPNVTGGDTRDDGSAADWERVVLGARLAEPLPEPVIRMTLTRLQELDVTP